MSWDDRWSMGTQLDELGFYSQASKPIKGGMVGGGLFIVVIIAVTILVGAGLIIAMGNHSDDGGSEGYHEVSKDYEVRYQWTNVTTYYIVEFDSEKDGYMVMDFGSVKGIYHTDVFYHAGHNYYMFPTTELLKRQPIITFYER